MFFAFLYIFYGVARMCFILQHIVYFIRYHIPYMLIYSYFHRFPDCKRTRVHIQNVPGSLSSIYIYEFLPSSVNQNSTPFSQFFTPYCWLCASMIALTIERPIPVPPYARVLALSTL